MIKAAILVFHTEKLPDRRSLSGNFLDIKEA